MPALLLPLLIKVLPYALIAIATGYVYLHIKAKGAAEEKAKLEADERKKVEAIKSQVQVAVNKDKAIDEKVQEKIDEINKTSAPVSNPVDGDTFKF